MHTTRIEQELTVLLRRIQRIHVLTSSGRVEVERSAYGILCRLADQGPHRLGSLAQAFGLDPSTITRQVQSLEGNGWVERHRDPSDRRAALLSLSEEGAQVLHTTRARRREALREALKDWPEADQEMFAVLLERFNLSIDELVRSRA